VNWENGSWEFLVGLGIFGGVRDFWQIETEKVPKRFLANDTPKRCIERFLAVGSFCRGFWGFWRGFWSEIWQKCVKIG